MELMDSRAKGKLELLAYERAEKDRKRLPAMGYFFDAAEAERICTWVETYLRHHKGEWAGKSFVLSPWQRFILSEVFGWKRPDGTRRYRTSYAEVARKNGKTELAAAVGGFMFVGDGEPGAEVYCAATKKDQARIAWEAFRSMVRLAPPALRQPIKVFRANMSCEQLQSKFEPLGADSNTLDGLNPSCAIVDELHAHKDRGVWDVLVTGMGARREPLMWGITTAGVYDPTMIGWELHDKAVKVLEGSLEDDSFFAFVCAADDTYKWTDERSWEQANPNIDVSVKRDYLEQQCKQAEQQPSFENTFKRLHLNVWTQQVTRWLSMERWHESAGPRFKEALFLGSRCFVGLDLSQKIDLTAGVLVFPDGEGGYDVSATFWMPERQVMERAQRDRVPYDAWVRDGWIQTTPGDYIDYAFIRKQIETWADKYEIREIAYDPWNAAELAQQLQNDGFREDRLVPFRQGYASMSEPCKELERLVYAKLLRHGDNPVLNWMAGNVAIREDPAANIKMDKEESVSKIDGMVALAMAIGRAMLHAGDPDFTGELMVL